tara:strand:- start:14552 stop:15607 length:1056 start_codon:yes stop_codon:yes gene_type:complete
MCSAFSMNGINTTLLATANKASKNNYLKIKDTIWSYYGVKNKFNIIWINFWYPNIRLKHFFHGLFTALFLINKNYSIIYTRSEWVAIFSSVLLRKKIVLELHNFKYSFSQKLVVKKSILNKNISIVCISSALKNELIKFGYTRKIITAHDAVDLDLFNFDVNEKKIRNKYDIPNSKPIITHIGSVRKGRGFETIIKASSKMQDCLFLFVCGHEADLEIINNQKNKKQNNIKFIDFIPNSEIPEILKSSDILLMTYTSELDTLRFTSPLKMFEYMASKKPIISSDFPVLREVLNDKNSLLIQPSNPKSLVDAINKLVDNKTLSEKISSQAYSDVNKYTWNKRAQIIIDFLRT